MKQGTIRNIAYMYDRDSDIVIIKTTIQYKSLFGINRLIDVMKYDYYGESLKVGDTVDFEINYNELYSRELEAIVKVNNKKAEIKRIK